MPDWSHASLLQCSNHNSLYGRRFSAQNQVTKYEVPGGDAVLEMQKQKQNGIVIPLGDRIALPLPIRTKGLLLTRSKRRMNAQSKNGPLPSNDTNKGAIFLE
jgi:hypothetical protein